MTNDFIAQVADLIEAGKVSYDDAVSALSDEARAELHHLWDLRQISLQDRLDANEERQDEIGGRDA